MYKLMAALQSQNLLLSSSSSSSASHRRVHASLNDLRARGISLARLPAALINRKELSLREENIATNYTQPPPTPSQKDEHLISKLYAIAEAAADRAEMHAIIGEQRNNWNILLTNSINSITLTASLMAGIAAIPVGEAPPQLALKVSSVILFTAATGVMLIVNKIQPSQLAEEQRNGARLWKQLEKSIHNALALRDPTELDVEEAMEKVLALDKAYPLPLLPGMLEKFPKTVEPACWWPRSRLRRRETHQKYVNGKRRNNGWSKELEEEMMGVLRVLKAKDEKEYVGVGKVVLDLNRTLATLGPLFAGLAAVGAGFVGSPAHGALPPLFAVAGGVLATVVNTLEHAGQVGMVFELLRNCAGFYRRLEEEIESNLEETDLEKRENGELFEMKMALHLGRSLSDLKTFASYASPSSESGDMSEFAGKLF